MQIATTKCSLEMMSQNIFDTFTFHANPKFWFSCATNFAHFKIICSTINVKEQQPNYKIKSFNSSQQLLLQFEVDVGDISIFHKHLFFFAKYSVPNKLFLHNLKLAQRLSTKTRCVWKLSQIFKFASTSYIFRNCLLFKWTVRLKRSKWSKWKQHEGKFIPDRFQGGQL